MRVLFLASFFPKPQNPLMGTWALGQAQALARLPIELRVLSFTSWVPRMAALTRGARGYADCPSRHDWGELEVEYPRWLYYPVEPFKSRCYRDPTTQMAIAWRSAGARFVRDMRCWKPDLVYCHHAMPNGYFAMRLRQELGFPYLITEHDFDEIDDCAHLGARRRFYGEVVESAFVVIAVAKRMEQSLAQLFPKANALTVYNGTRLPALDEPPAPRSDDDDRLVVLSCGSFVSRKGFPLLVEAFARVAQRHPRALLRIVGDGEERALIEAEIARGGLEGRVELPGMLPHDAVVAEMGRCDLFALVGWDEPFATVFIEAMSCGKPIVTADDGGINDLVRDGREAVVVEARSVASAAAGLDRLLSDGDSRRRMGAAARALVETRLTWDANAARMQELFEAAVGARSGSSAPMGAPVAGGGVADR